MMTKESKGSGARGALFVPTGHYDLDRLRIDGISTWCRWYKAAAGGAAAGLTLVFAVFVLYLVFAMFAAGVAAVQFDLSVARTELVNSMTFAAEYARYAWLSSIAMAVIGVAYALLHRLTVANGYYLRLGPWEVGFDTLFAAAAGYGGFSLAASAWEPLGVVHAWLFWAWGPVFAWVLARLHELYVLWMVRPDWALSIESAVRVLMPRRFGCDASELRVELDDEAYAVTVYARMNAGEAVRARELIQAIPETRSVTVAPLPQDEPEDRTQSDGDEQGRRQAAAAFDAKSAESQEDGVADASGDRTVAAVGDGVGPDNGASAVARPGSASHDETVAFTDCGAASGIRPVTARRRGAFSRNPEAAAAEPAR